MIIFLKQISYPLNLLHCLVLAILVCTNTAYGYFAPDFSDCLEGHSEEHDQVDACETLLWNNTERRDLYVALGTVLEKRNKYKKALKIYQKALLVFPNDSYFLSKLSITKPDSTVKKDIKTQDVIQKQIIKQQSMAKQQSETITKPQAVKVAKQQAEKVTKQQASKLSPKQEQFLTQIKLLKSLKTQEIISQAEYDKRKKMLLDDNFRLVNKPATNLVDVKSKGVIKNQTALNKDEDILKKLNFGNYHALIIGNNQYKHLPELKTAVNDAQSLAKLLKNEYGFKVNLLINADRYKTLRLLGKLRNTLTKNDNLLIYYAGHGVLDEASERGYWLPIDAEREFTSNWISTAEITDTLKALQSWHVLIVADSCYSGTLVRSAPITFKNPEEKQKLIKRLHRKKSRTAITSGGLEPVADSGGDNHSVFAQAFLEVLQNNNSVIGAENIFSSLRDKVILNADQTPEYSNIRKVGHNGGDFIFKRQ